jgi:putative CocE/NonD family hydrolase
LPPDLEVIDIPSAELHVTSSLAHTDLYVRVSDVAPSGAITHVSDALRRLAADQPIDGMVEVELAPVAHRFQRGHRIRVQVAGAAYPRWDRNLGTGEPPATASAMRAADQQVHHAPHRPSVLVERARVTRSTPSTARSSLRRSRLVTTIWQPGSALHSSRTCWGSRDVA